MVWNQFHKLWITAERHLRLTGRTLLFIPTLREGKHSHTIRSQILIGKCIESFWHLQVFYELAFQESILEICSNSLVQKAHFEEQRLHRYPKMCTFNWILFHCEYIFVATKCESYLGISLKFVAIFTIITAIFDIYCLGMAAPGSTHYGYYFISYEFVYVGNVHGKFL